MSQYELNARNLLCPLPVIKVQNKVRELQVGDELRVICTDPGALEDIPIWCRMYGHQIVNIDRGEREFVVVLRVG